MLAAAVAPAVLLNACCILTLGLSDRPARVVDRTRVVLIGLAREGKCRYEPGHESSLQPLPLLSGL